MEAFAGANYTAAKMIDTSIVGVRQRAARVARNKRQSIGPSGGGLTSNDGEAGQLTRAVQYALKDRDRLNKLAKTTHDHGMRHHTPRALAYHVEESILRAAGWSQSNAISR